MDERRKKHGWPFWIAVTLIVVPILYIATFGPAVWVVARANHGESIVELLYWPILWEYVHGSNAVSHVIDWYGCAGIPKKDLVTFNVLNSDGATRAYFFVE